MESARSLFEEMIELGLAPNMITFSLMITGSCRNNETTKARKLMTREMPKFDLTPGTMIFNCLTNGYERWKTKRRQENAPSHRKVWPEFTRKLIRSTKSEEPLLSQNKLLES
jgi:pentatricopeptide repeat protein